MRQLRIVLLCCLVLHGGVGLAHGLKKAFLAERAQALAEADIRFPDSVCMWGFGAFHGSAKTEDAELLLLEKVLTERDSVWYFPETDFSTAHYFESYLHSGNDSLLRQLVTAYGMRVPQERTVEVYEKWRRLRTLVRGRNFRVIGVDPICSPVFAMRYLLDSMPDEAWCWRKQLMRLFEVPGAVTRLEYEELLQHVLADYAARPEYYAAHVRDSISYGYVIRDLRHLNERREPAIVRNYMQLDARFDFRSRAQVVRMGVGHILKEQQDGWHSFFNRLVALGVYRREEICTIQCFLTRSRVVWNEQWDQNGNYAGYTTKGAWGVADSWRERFKGIRRLKAYGDMTYFDLRGQGSPYAQAGCLDLVVCRRPFGCSECCPEGAATLDYLDAAVLIRDSRASRPIYELEEN